MQYFAIVVVLPEPWSSSIARRLREKGGNRGCLSKDQADAGRKFRDAVNRGEFGPRIRIISADQSDREEMRSVVRELSTVGAFDIVIEDGSHNNADQQMNLALLFPLLRPGGVYAIEDIHSSWQQKYDEPPGGNKTTWRMIEHFRATGQIKSKHMHADEIAYLERWIGWAKSQVTGGFRTDQTCLVSKRLVA